MSFKLLFHVAALLLLQNVSASSTRDGPYLRNLVRDSKEFHQEKSHGQRQLQDSTNASPTAFPTSSTGVPTYLTFEPTSTYAPTITFSPTVTPYPTTIMPTTKSVVSPANANTNTNTTIVVTNPNPGTGPLPGVGGPGGGTGGGGGTGPIQGPGTSPGGGTGPIPGPVVQVPTAPPTPVPTANPTKKPTQTPTKEGETLSPTKFPTKNPTASPTKSPTPGPTVEGATASPTAKVVEEVTNPDTPDPNEIADIPTVATENGSFNTLVAALGAGDLVGTLSSEGPFTVFAPTDDAFAALPEGLVDCLLIPDNVGTLRTILTYHVLSGSFLSTDLVDGTTPATVQGESVTVSLGDSVKINESTVIIADVPASNGVIHAVDAVLVPPSINVAAFLDACPSDDTGDTGTGSENRGDEETGDAGDDADIITTGTIAPTPIPTGRNNPLNNGGNIFAQLQWLFSFLGRSNNNVPRNPPESTPDRPLPPRSIFRFAGRNGSATRVIPNNIMV